MPPTLRITLSLALLSILVLFFIPPPSRYLSLLRRETLPRLNNPAFASGLNAGMTNSQWTRDWVPLPAARQNSRLSDPRDPSLKSWSLLNLGRHWFHLLVFYYSWFVMLILSLAAYMAARLSARTLASPLPLLAAFGLLFLFIYPIDFDPVHLHTLESTPVSMRALMGRVWSVPIGIVAAALLTSLIPFPRVEPRPTMIQRFLALLRDGSFFSLSLISLAFYTTSLNLQDLEKRIESEQKPARRADSPQNGAR